MSSRSFNIKLVVLLVVFLTACGGNGPNLDAEGVRVSEDGTVYYLVNPGDTLWGISKEVDVPLEYILELNDLKEETVIFPGQRLTIGSLDEDAAAAYVATHGAGPGPDYKAD